MSSECNNTETATQISTPILAQREKHMLTVDKLTEEISKTPRYLHIHIYKKALAKSILHKPWISKKKLYIILSQVNKLKRIIALTYFLICKKRKSTEYILYSILVKVQLSYSTFIIKISSRNAVFSNQELNFNSNDLTQFTLKYNI